MEDDCKIKYEDIQKRHKHRFVTFHIENNKEIKVDQVGERSATVGDFFDALKIADKDCRYGVLDYEFTHEAEGTGASKRDAIVLIMYAPDTAAIKKKMIYAASFDTVKKAFNGVSVIMNVNEECDLTEETINEKATKNLRK